MHNHHCIESYLQMTPSTLNNSRYIKLRQTCTNRQHLAKRRRHNCHPLATLLIHMKLGDQSYQQTQMCKWMHDG